MNKFTKCNLLTLLLIAVLPFAVQAKFTVHSVSGKVEVERAGKKMAVTAGMEVGGVDKILIMGNSAIEILNSADSKVYRCEEAGSFTTTRIMMNAARKSKSKVGAIAKSTRFGSGGAQKGGTVYSEGCLVTRALETYDPEGATTQIDAAQLAHTMAQKMMGAASDTLPTPLSHGLPTTGDGLEFSVDNTLDFPVYVNVVKCTGEGKDKKVAISELGQPVGCYILLPGQSLMRRHSKALDTNDKHMLIMTRCYFDIDEVIEKSAVADADGPVLGSGHIYVTRL